jgi:hypothetical protein
MKRFVVFVCGLVAIEMHFVSLACNYLFSRFVIILEDRAVAQAVSRWLPTATARVRVRTACGVCGGQSGTGAGFLRVLLLPLPIIPPNFPS